MAKPKEPGPVSNLPSRADGEAILADTPAPSKRQKDRIATAQERRKGRPARVRIKVHSSGNNTATISPVHNDWQGHADHFNDAFGTSSDAFSTELLQQLGGVVGTDPQVISEQPTNAALAAVDGIAPQNEAEAMLAVQMAATHNVAMFVLKRAKFATTMPGI